MADLAFVANDHGTVLATMIFNLVAPAGVIAPVGVELRYDSRNPYEIAMKLNVGADGQVDWVIARDLLADGLIATPHRRRHTTLSTTHRRPGSTPQIRRTLQTRLPHPHRQLFSTRPRGLTSRLLGQTISRCPMQRDRNLIHHQIKRHPLRRLHTHKHRTSHAHHRQVSVAFRSNCVKTPGRGFLASLTGVVTACGRRQGAWRCVISGIVARRVGPWQGPRRRRRWVTSS
ncbi:SsgA family sporulation/cell division regulator [Saccharopolyspora spinosa]|uniref:SsgA family sporulation/cell division regulator n=1 Tax=Saccharopolyspora spinosa TaxID=60894 RepID=UPI001ED94415|nr:SsgA family sporulation/cell division regulator [Saccharopolyspora spinosa]